MLLANGKLCGNPLLGGIQATGNSNAIRAAWQPLRQAGVYSNRSGGGNIKHALRAGRMLHEEIAAAVHGVRTGRKSASNHQFYVVA